MAYRAAPGGALLSEQDADNDGEREIVLENAYARLVLKPSVGAATSLAVKPGLTELVFAGRTRALVLVNTEAERQVIELAQRFSTDFRRVTHGATGWKLPCELVNTWNPQAAAAHQGRILEKEPLDVIIMNAQWDLLAPEVVKLIMKRVENGTGLVVIFPRRQG